MKFKLWIFVMSIFVMGGCTTDELTTPSEMLGNNAITMNATVNDLMRNSGMDATAKTLESGVSVYAYKTETYTSPPFINNVIFKTEPNTNYWSSSPVYYWPSYPLDFFGFYPITIAPTDLSEPSKFSYTTNSNASKQVDVVFGCAINQYKEMSVPLRFRHALSKISFVFKSKANSDLHLTVNSVGINHIPLNGTFAYDKNAIAIPYFEVTNQTDINNATMAFSDALQIGPGASTDTISGLYLIPHHLDNWAYGASSVVSYPMKGSYININGKYTGLTSYTGNIAIPLTTKKWLPGMHYIYNITFGDLSGSTGGGGYNPDVADPKNPNKPEQLIIRIIIKAVVEPWQKVDETVDI